MDISPTTSEADPVHYLLAARVCSGTSIIQTNEGFMCSLQLLVFLICRYHSGNCFEKPQTNGALDVGAYLLADSVYRDIHHII